MWLVVGLLSFVALRIVFRVLLGQVIIMSLACALIAYALMATIAR